MKNNVHIMEHSNIIIIRKPQNLILVITTQHIATSDGNIHRYFFRFAVAVL